MLFEIVSHFVTKFRKNIVVTSLTMNQEKVSDDHFR